MIYSLTGKVVFVSKDMVALDVNGVSYGCTTSQVNTQNIVLDSVITLKTYLHIYENGMTLFGFLDDKELNCFKMLISVSGVGPKAAISLLGAVSYTQIAFCIATNDAKTLTKAPGIGGKTAARIVLELKDKIKEEDLKAMGKNSDEANFTASSVQMDQALEALLVLGFNQNEALRVLKKAPGGLSCEEYIKYALANS